MSAWVRMVEDVTGERPPECPWMAFRDPTVIDVLSAYRSVQAGFGATPALLLPSDPPHHVWEGLLYYSHIRAKVNEHEEKLEAENAAAKAGR